MVPKIKSVNKYPSYPQISIFQGFKALFQPRFLLVWSYVFVIFVELKNSRK